MEMSRKVCVLLGFFAYLCFQQSSYAQPDEEEANENSGGVIERYGRNAAIGIDSVIADPDSSPLLRNYSSVTDELLRNPPDSD